MNKCAVIFGGGSYGAYHVGTLARLGINFDEVYGTSTGALQAPLVALGEYDRLREAYTSLNQYDVFDGYWSNPIKSNGKVNLTKSAIRLARGKKTLGSTKKALPKTIQKFYTEQDHYRLQNSTSRATVCVTNLSKANPSLAEYFDSNTSMYEEFVKMMTASASFPAVMSSIIHNGQEYVDGGLVESGPVEKAMATEPKEIHLFVHKTSIYENREMPITKNFGHLLMRMVYSMTNEVQLNDLHEHKLKTWGALYGVKSIHVHWMKKEYTNRLVFDKGEMQKMYEDGFNDAIDLTSKIDLY